MADKLVFANGEFRFYCTVETRWPAKNAGFRYIPEGYWTTTNPSIAKHLSAFATQSALDELRRILALRQAASKPKKKSKIRWGTRRRIGEKRPSNSCVFLVCPDCEGFGVFTPTDNLCDYCGSQMPADAIVEGMKNQPQNLLTEVGVGA